MLLKHGLAGLAKYNAGSSAAFSDDFTRANEQLDAGANWATGYTNATMLNIVSNELVIDGTGTAYAGTTSSFAEDCRVTITVESHSSAFYVAPVCRLLNESDNYNFRFQFDGTTASELREGGGTVITSGVLSVPSTPFTLSVEAVGSTIKGYVNGVEVLSGTNSTVTGSRPAGLRKYSEGALCNISLFEVLEL